MKIKWFKTHKKNSVLQLFVAHILIEHQEWVVKNVMKNVKISDTIVYYWLCTIIKNNELLKDQEL